MKTIVCYGDSNTWGFMPKKKVLDWTENRFPYELRWPGVLQGLLGAGYRVEEEGLNGRTTFLNDPLDACRNGLSYIDVCMLTKMPVDLVILMLGTNDVKEHLNATPLIISRGIAKLAERIQKSGCGRGGKAPEILLVAPARLHENLKNGWPAEEFGAGALEKDARLAAHYEAVAREFGLHFFNAAALLTADPADGVHLNESGHALLAEKLCAEVLRILQ